MICKYLQKSKLCDIIELCKIHPKTLKYRRKKMREILVNPNALTVVANTGGLLKSPIGKVIAFQDGFIRNEIELNLRKKRFQVNIFHSVYMKTVTGNNFSWSKLLTTEVSKFKRNKNDLTLLFVSGRIYVRRKKNNLFDCPEGQVAYITFTQKEVKFLDYNRQTLKEFAL